MIRRAPRLLLAASVAAAAATALGLTITIEAAPTAQAAEVPHAAGFMATPTWHVQLNDPGNPVALSSPNVATLGERATHPSWSATVGVACTPTI